ncbi:uncharacterized protein LOC135152721 [Daucus carota subsp. sativus]|uniref:uncharacterized protein LOC135152721 n=1 Tax=Daucus carota subsp. sativus TaxID=79200 RepID=UPI003082D451
MTNTTEQTTGNTSNPNPGFDFGNSPEGLLPTPEEQQQMLLKWREEQAAKAQSSKTKEQEAARLAKKREADELRLKALQLQREEIELQERALREALEAEGDRAPEGEGKKKRNREDQDGSSDSESHSRGPRHRHVTPSDTEGEEGPHVRDRLRRMEKAMFGDKTLTHEPVIVEEIEQYRPPPGRQFPKMNEFNGKGDPIDHCDKYESLMTGMGHCDIMLCKMFKTYLKGSATMWYRSLRPRSVSSYDQLKRKFLRHYSHLCRREKDTEALIHCRQRPNEELGDYLARFKEEAGMVTNLDKVKAAGFLTAGLDPVKGKKLRSSLYDIPPKSLNDIYLRGESIRRKMESIGGHKSDRKDDRYSSRSDGRGKRNDSHRGRRDERDEKLDRGAERRRDRDSTVFTPLNTSVSKILNEIKGKPGFVRPPKMKIPDYKKNSDKYCDYHRDNGHNTDECYHLKKLIERMVKAGDLNQYVKDLRDRLGPKEDKGKAPEEGERYRGEVRTIFGGTILDRSSKTAKKKYARQVYNLYSINSTKQSYPIMFSQEDYEDVMLPHEDPLVINPVIGQNKIWKVLVDGGSSVNVLYYNTYQKMNLEGKQIDTCYEAPLYGFGNQPVPIEGTIHLPLLLGKSPYTVEKQVKFYVVRVESPFNAILGRPVLTAFEAIASIPHLKLKFPTEEGVGEMRGDQKAARIIMLEDLEKDKDLGGAEGNKRRRTEDGPGGSGHALHIELEKFGNDLSNPIAEPGTETEEVELYAGCSGKMVRIGKDMEPGLKEKVIDVVRRYHDVFAWGPEDMPGLDESIARHRLNVHPQAVPVKQKKRNFAVERQKVIEAEVEKLLEAKFIEEIEYPEWLANVVVVKKSNNKWRMCVDYTDLNKNCPKDHYPLPNIDQLIDATSGYQILSFLDAFSGYHQIAMDAEDIPKTAFITPKGTYAYIKMPFGLKNAGATFQRMVNKVFADQIGRNMECYVDDMIVKSLFQDHADDLKECFETLRRNNMKINPAKCTFGVCSGKFLGYMVSARGIEANPEKIKAVIEMEAPKTIRDIQKLTGRLAALRRFISRSAEKALPFFEVLKGAKNFEWGPNCIKAFEEIKEYLVKAPLLLRPDPKETLQLYLAVSDRTLGAVLVKEHEKNQHPVFYVSHMLRDAETRYPNAEKFAYGLVMASRKLRHYFQGRTIQVVTDQPLKKILSRPEASGRVVAWSVELGEYDLEYVPRTAIKAQALVDFMVECRFSGPTDLEPKEQLIRTPGRWKLFVDGSVAGSKCGAGLILSSPDGFEICQAIRFTFPLTNNEAEYEALLAGMGLAKNLEVRHLRAFSDSMLVVKHFSGEYEQKEPRTKAYAAKVREQTQFFETFELSAIGREDNGRADALSRLASAETQNLTGSIYLTEVKMPSVDKKACLEIHQGINWMTPIRAYLEKGFLPLGKKEAQKIKYRAASYTLIGGRLFRRSVSQPLLRCLDPEEQLLALETVHEGICGEHLAGRSLALKILRQGFFWPTIREDAANYSKKCRQCQIHSNVPKQPPEEMTSVLSPIPFSMWAIDIVGILPTSTRQAKYCIVAIDYMTKWVEARPLSAITEQAAKKFFLEQIIVRFGIPMVCVSDNGTQFVGRKFKEFLASFGIQQRFSSVGHPQGNGAIEAANKIIFHGIKKRLGEAKGLWAEELPWILWAYRTTPRSSTGETPFRLAYGTDSLVPVEVGLESYRTQVFDPDTNEYGLRGNLDLLEEEREAAHQRNVRYQQQASQYYDSGIRKRSFRVGDMVLRDLATSMPTKQGKLMPNWEGPYTVVEIVRPGTYKLAALDGNPIKNTWHASQLRKYYQ